MSQFGININYSKKCTKVSLLVSCGNRWTVWCTARITEEWDILSDQSDPSPSKPAKRLPSPIFISTVLRMHSRWCQQKRRQYLSSTRMVLPTAVALLNSILAFHSIVIRWICRKNCNSISASEKINKIRGIHCIYAAKVMVHWKLTWGMCAVIVHWLDLSLTR